VGSGRFGKRQGLLKIRIRGKTVAPAQKIIRKLVVAYATIETRRGGHTRMVGSTKEESMCRQGGECVVFERRKEKESETGMTLNTT